MVRSSGTQAERALAGLSPGWTKLVAPPFVRARAVSLWTGQELFYWGGDSNYGGETHSDGAVFNPAAGKWRETAASPIEGRSTAGAVWTGAEVLIWGGGGDGRSPLDDGAAYDPATDAWRMLPPAPLSARAPVAAVWTGTEMILWGDYEREAGAADGAAYDPATNQWHTIASAPAKLNLADAVWTGTEMVVFGAELDHNNASSSGHARGIAYDPMTDEWHKLADVALSPQASTSSWTGDEVLVWDYELSAATYDPKSNEWSTLPDVPLDFSECYPASASTIESVFALFCSRPSSTSNAVCGAPSNFQRNLFTDGRWRRAQCFSSRVPRTKASTTPCGPSIPTSNPFYPIDRDPARRTIGDPRPIKHDR